MIFIFQKNLINFTWYYMDDRYKVKKRKSNVDYEEECCIF